MTEPNVPAEPAETVVPTVPTEPTEPTVPTVLTEPATPAVKARRFRRLRALFAPLLRVLDKIPHPPLRSRRGLLVLGLLVAGFTSIATIGGVAVVHYSETASFCGSCHTMDPELKAYAISPHKEVTCGECHVEPGVAGFVKAKANGTKQLMGIITGNYPTPIPPPDHAKLPSVEDSCLECHSMKAITDNGGPVKLVLRPRYQLNEANTRETVAVMLRPAGLGDANGATGARGIHWHVEQNVTFTSSEEGSQKIDLVEVKAEDGSTRQYIAGTEVGVSTDVQPDIDRLKQTQATRPLDCLGCHNRVGHAIPNTDKAVDEAITSGRISADLPFIKRDSVALLNGNYPSLEAADEAISGLRTSYASEFPLVIKDQSAQVTRAINELKTVYRLIGTPEMKVQASTYPDNMGHQSSPGCFRCHDDSHFLVEKGKITNEKIPSTCATCHTFPQVGASASSFPLGAKPADHKDGLYVFDHKDSVKGLQPAGTSCGTCHQKSYCESCHNSGAVKVKHTEMLYNHVSSITAAGGTQACATCHVPAYCARCHKEPVLDTTARPAAIRDPVPGAAVTPGTAGAIGTAAVPLAIKGRQTP